MTSYEYMIKRAEETISGPIPGIVRKDIGTNCNYKLKIKKGEEIILNTR